MGIDEFLNTKLSGVLFAIAMLIEWACLWYNVGYQSGYTKGMTKNPENSEATSYVYSDGRILRFAPGDKPIVIDLEKGTVTTILPADEKNKQEKD